MKHQIDLDNIWLYGVLENTLKIVVYPSSMYGFWLPLWYLQTLLEHIGSGTAYPSGAPEYTLDFSIFKLFLNTLDPEYILNNNNININ
jgi:hypothetical protein